MATTYTYERMDAPQSNAPPATTYTYAKGDPNAPDPAEQPQYSSQDYADYINSALQDRSIGGSLYRGGVGVLQGAVLDPIEAAGEPIEALGKNLGIDVGAAVGPYVPGRIKDVARGARQIARQSAEGNVGRVGGAIASPFNKLVPDLPGLAAAVRESGPGARALERVLQSALKGTVGSTLVPQERDSKGIWDWTKGEARKAELPALVGGAFGVPSALARLTRRPAQDWRDVVRPFYEHFPYVGRYVRGVRTDLGDAGLNTAMYDYILRPLRRTAAAMPPPTEASWDSVRAIRQHLGRTLDQVERTATWTHNRGSETILRTAASYAVNNLPPQLVPQYRNIIQRIFNDNLFNPTTGVYRGHLDNARFHYVVSQLRDVAENMDTGHPDQRLISHALRNFRQALIDSASMPIGMRDLWRLANNSYSRFARFREGLLLGNRNGVVPARNFDTAMRQHDPFGYSTGDAEGQQMVQAAMNAMASQRAAAVRTLQGRQPWNPADWAQRAGAGTAEFPWDNGDQ